MPIIPTPVDQSKCPKCGNTLLHRDAIYEPNDGLTCDVCDTSWLHGENPDDIKFPTFLPEDYS